MARRKVPEGTYPPKDIAASNFDAAVDQLRDYESLASALIGYRDNVGDTIVEYYGDDIRALHEGLRSYDRRIKKLWVQLKAAAGSMRGDAKKVFVTWVEQQEQEYYGGFAWPGRLEESHYGHIETEAPNPRGRKSKKNPKSTKRVTNVRSLVSKALK